MLVYLVGPPGSRWIRFLEEHVRPEFERVGHVVYVCHHGPRYEALVLADAVCVVVVRDVPSLTPGIVLGWAICAGMPKVILTDRPVVDSTLDGLPRFGITCRKAARLSLEHQAEERS
jgi:hypothetical protein